MAQGFYVVAIKVSAGAASQGWTGETLSRSLTRLVSRPRVSASCWPETSVPCCAVLCTGLLTTWQFASLWASEGSEGERTWDSQQDGSRSFCNLISEVTPHPWCCILSFRSESRYPAHTQGERGRVPEGCEFHKVGIPDSCVTGCLPQWPSVLKDFVTRS